MPLWVLWADPDGAAMGLDNLFDIGKSETGALRFLAVEGIEDIGHIFCAYADAVIADLHLNKAVTPGVTYPDRNLSLAKPHPSN